jgi:hypothetical protein
MAMFYKVVVSSALLTVLGACSHIDPQTGSADRQFGEAVAWNKQVQLVNPEPVYTAQSSQPGSDADKAAAASKRYRTDAVRNVERVQTSSSSGSDNGSGPK